MKTVKNVFFWKKRSSLDHSKRDKSGFQMVMAAILFSTFKKRVGFFLAKLDRFIQKMFLWSS
jgi:hypothetical protein